MPQAMPSTSGTGHLLLEQGRQAGHHGAAQDHRLGMIAHGQVACGARDLRVQGLGIFQHVGGARIQAMHACEPSGQAVACDDLAQDPALRAP